MSNWHQDVVFQEPPGPRERGFWPALRTGITLTAVGLSLIAGLVIVSTPKEDFTCDFPRRVAIAPAEPRAGQLAYCLMEHDPWATKVRIPINTGICTTDKTQVVSMLEAEAIRREAAFQECKASRAAPWQATWNFVVRQAQRLWS